MCTLISAFGLSCIRSDHLITIGVGGEMSRKKVKDIFQNNIQDLGLILL